MTQSSMKALAFNNEWNQQDNIIKQHAFRDVDAQNITMRWEVPKNPLRALHLAGSEARFGGVE